MIWNVVYDDLTRGDVAAGGYLSVATVMTDPLPNGFSSKVIAGRPERQRWNITTLEFEPEPPAPPDVDRATEFLTRVGSSLKGNAKTKVQDELIILLGDNRFRDPADTYVIGAP